MPSEEPRPDPRHHELEEALDRGAGELPPNRPRGLLGEVGLDVRKIDGTGPSIFGGMTQELDVRTVWLGMVVAYLLFFPLGYIILWRSRQFSLRMKVGYTVAFTIGVAVAAYALLSR